MPAIAVVPIILKDVAFKVAADDYSAHVSQVEFAPSSSVQTWKGLTPAAVFSAGTSATWVANLTFAQDWKTPDSLSRYLFDNEGKTVAVTFAPETGETGSTPTFTASLIIAPGSIGGSVDAYAVSTVSLGVQGRPTIATV